MEIAGNHGRGNWDRTEGIDGMFDARGSNVLHFQGISPLKGRGILLLRKIYYSG